MIQYNTQEFGSLHFFLIQYMIEFEGTKEKKRFLFLKKHIIQFTYKISNYEWIRERTRFVRRYRLDGCS